MKKIVTLVFVLLLFPWIASTAQENDVIAGKPPKRDQSTLFNEVNIAYGIGTLYLFTSPVSHDYDTYDTYSSSRTDIYSPGSIIIGYNRMLNKVLMIGFMASYINCNYKMTFTNYDGTPQGEGTVNDNLLSGIAKVTLNYVNKPKVRVYSAIGMGITIDLSNMEGTFPQQATQTDRAIRPAGQIVFMGVRFGRAFGGFCEFGIGTNSIISAGLNYQFAD